ncbi:leucine-rich repeat-containing protein 14B isoform X2 [Sceloporus undulatus]|uniref:leucine-rich repeat-containing protein 14B isoform X2 n=1 Tax=Sceloporus undulatus TaxID=8520 RepID=UPI001C4C6EC4|nr:leucine-rich repeat-containing protein 14B isoform X2 [Sceloporus undulatus]
MHSLRFISAEALVTNTQVVRENLGSLAHNLFPLLFKASYLQEQGEVIHNLVENWPLPELNIGRLLGKTTDHQEDISNRACSVCLASCLTGLRDYVLNFSSPYAKRLKRVDLTGIKDVEVQLCRCRKTIGRWARTEFLSKICYDLLVDMHRLQLSPDVFEISIDVFMDIFVTEQNYELVVQALLMRCHCPLKIRCAAFRVDNLALKKLFYLTKLTEPSSLGKFEVIHNVRMEMEHLLVLLNNVQFPQLTSLTLPARTFDVRRFTPEDDATLARVGVKLSQMTRLTELSLAFSILTGRIRKLLSPLKTPLKMLDVSNCSLNHVDMAYLANSLHSNHLEVLDMSGHDVADLYPSTFFKLLNHSSHTLKSLTLEECNIQDTHLNMLILGLVPCWKLEEFKFLGNPLSSRALKCLFNVFTDFPRLKYIEYPVPKDCYANDIGYPIDEADLSKFDHQKYDSIAEDLNMILLQAKRDDIKATTPLFGAYDAALYETGNELGKSLLQSFRETLQNFSMALQQMS